MREIQQGPSHKVSEADFITLIVDDRFQSLVDQRDECDDQLKELAGIRSKFRSAVPGLRGPDSATEPLQADEVDSALAEISQLRAELRGARVPTPRRRSRRHRRRAFRHHVARRVAVVCGAAIVPLIGLATLLVGQ